MATCSFTVEGRNEAHKKIRGYYLLTKKPCRRAFPFIMYSDPDVNEDVNSIHLVQARSFCEDPPVPNW